MKLEHISLNLVLSFERGVHLFDFSSLYFSSSSFNFSLYFFVLSLLELMIYAIIYTSYERKRERERERESGMVHIKEPLLLIDKSSLCGSNGFPF